LNDKAKAKAEADAKIRAQQEKGETSSEATKDASNGSETTLTVPLTKETAGDKSSPFEPPYVEDLFVGELEGLEGEEGMVALVSAETTASGLSTDHFAVLAQQGEYIAANHVGTMTNAHLMA
jgi:hypothetical protein